MKTKNYLTLVFLGILSVNTNAQENKAVERHDVKCRLYYAVHF
jgi:hypothetical protein